MILFKIVYFVAAPFFKLLYRIKVTGKENIPEGSAVMCANHSSLMDPIFLCIACGIRQNWVFMAKAELFKIPFLNWLIKGLGAIAVNRGATDISTLRNAIDALKSGKKVMIFPEGTRVREGEDEVAAKNGAAMIASRAACSMVPVYISPKKHLFGKVIIKIAPPVSTEVEEKGQAKYKKLIGEVFDEIQRMRSGDESCAGN